MLHSITLHALVRCLALEQRKEYDNLQPEFDVIRAIVDARTSQNLTQKQLAEKTGINQADISKLENGTRNPKAGTDMSAEVTEILDNVYQMR